MKAMLHDDIAFMQHFIFYASVSMNAVKHVQMCPGVVGQTSNSHRSLHASSSSVRQSDPLEQLFHSPSSLFQPRYGNIYSVLIAL